jgi:hypothetical protein
MLSLLSGSNQYRLAPSTNKPIHVRQQTSLAGLAANFIGCRGVGLWVVVLAALDSQFVGKQEVEPESKPFLFQLSAKSPFHEPGIPA